MRARCHIDGKPRGSGHLCARLYGQRHTTYSSICALECACCAPSHPRNRRETRSRIATPAASRFPGFFSRRRWSRRSGGRKIWSKYPSGSWIRSLGWGRGGCRCRSNRYMYCASKPFHFGRRPPGTHPPFFRDIRAAEADTLLPQVFLGLRNMSQLQLRRRSPRSDHLDTAILPRE